MAKQNFLRETINETGEKSSSWDNNRRSSKPLFIPTPTRATGSVSLSSLKPATTNDAGQPQPTAWKYVSKRTLLHSESKSMPKCMEETNQRATRLEAVMDPVTKSFKLKPVSGGDVKCDQTVWSALKHVERTPLQNSSKDTQLDGSVSSCSVVTSSCDDESVETDPKDELSIQFEKNLEIAFELRKVEDLNEEPVYGNIVKEIAKIPEGNRLSDHPDYEPKSSTSSGRDDSDSNSPRSSSHMGPGTGFLIDDEIGDQPDLLTNSNGSLSCRNF